MYNNSAGGEGIVPLVAALQAGACLQLQHLDIGGNGAGEVAISPLSTALQVGACPQLRHLNISGNSAGDEGLPMFCAALATATVASACPLLCEMYIR
jgi:hypothetical protein